jgi:hypothetical protein
MNVPRPPTSFRSRRYICRQCFASRARSRVVTSYIVGHELTKGTYLSLAVLVREMADQVDRYGSLAKFPADAVGNTRNDIYLAAEAMRNFRKMES